MTKHKRRTPIMLGIAAMTLAACGSGSTSAKVSTGPTTPRSPAKTAPSTTIPSIPSSEISTTTSLAPQKSPLPSVQILDTANGQTVQFASLLPAVKPVLFWFWAPH